MKKLIEKVLNDKTYKYGMISLNALTVLISGIALFGGVGVAVFPLLVGTISGAIGIVTFNTEVKFN